LGVDREGQYVGSPAREALMERTLAPCIHSSLCPSMKDVLSSRSYGGCESRGEDVAVAGRRPRSEQGSSSRGSSNLLSVLPSEGRHPMLHARDARERISLRRRTPSLETVVETTRTQNGRFEPAEPLTMALGGVQAVRGCFRTAPAGISPCSRKRHRSMARRRASATMPMRRRRLPP
jgi:hypothetical protein